MKLLVMKGKISKFLILFTALFPIHSQCYVGKEQNEERLGLFEESRDGSRTVSVSFVCGGTISCDDEFG